MLTSLLQYSDLGMFLLRLAVAVIFIYHGLPKLRNAKSMAAGIGMSTASVFVLGLLEVLASIAFILGLDVQTAALVLGIIMIGAIFMKMKKWGMPFSAHDKTGWEFDFILLFASIALLLTGGGSIGI